MQTYLPYLQPLLNQQADMQALLIRWANINSGSQNIEGLAQMLEVIQKEFKRIDGFMTVHSIHKSNKNEHADKNEKLSYAKVLSITKHEDAPFKVLLNGHYDTVYPPTDPFQTCHFINDKRLCGPGTADMKGGLVVLLYALLALEKSPFASKIGWQVILNPDEEIGSPGSEALLRQSAANNQIGMVFEPSFPDGSFVSTRKGTANYKLSVKGQSAHAGRDFHKGRNAIAHLAALILEIEKLNHPQHGITVNIGLIHGGVAANIVAAHAECLINIRCEKEEEMDKIQYELENIAAEGNNKEGFKTLLKTETRRPPKCLTPSTEKYFYHVQKCAQEVGIDLKWQPSGGGSDGSLLAAENLPTLDTFGVVGGHLHTNEEYVDLESLSQRACLAALFLMKLANREISLD